MTVIHSPFLSYFFWSSLRFFLFIQRDLVSLSSTHHHPPSHYIHTLRGSNPPHTMIADESLFHYALLTLYLMAPPTFISLRFLQAPYGKHHRSGWGPNLPPPLAWFLMESPTLWLTLLLFPHGNNSSNPKSFILITPFLLHYLNRTCLYPLRLLLTKTTKKTTSGFPLSVALMAFAFNLLNSYIQARWVSHYKDYGDEKSCFFWWVFFVGLLVFLCGMGINVWSDRELLRLKGEGKGYVVPKGGLFELVSCPNYFGEIVEWLGWALMTWSWAGLGFFIYTFANLGPRAVANHQWYLEKFGEDYPRKRKAVIPYLYWFFLFSLNCSFLWGGGGCIGMSWEKKRQWECVAAEAFAGKLGLSGMKLDNWIGMILRNFLFSFQKLTILSQHFFKIHLFFAYIKGWSTINSFLIDILMFKISINRT